jgi:hypothetical protein
MINLSGRVPALYPRRARAELSAAWEHLLTAAQEAARQVGDTSRGRGPLARRARRGDLSTLPWRWAGAGLAAGVIIGAVAAAALTRRPHPADPAAPEQPDDAPSAALDNARTAAAVGAEQTSAAVHTAGREPAAESAPPPPTVPTTDSDG